MKNRSSSSSSNEKPYGRTKHYNYPSRFLNNFSSIISHLPSTSGLFFQHFLYSLRNKIDHFQHSLHLYPQLQSISQSNKSHSHPPPKLSSESWRFFSSKNDNNTPTQLEPTYSPYDPQEVFKEYLTEKEQLKQRRQQIHGLDPPSVPLPPENFPENLQLIQVQIITRHGLRTPLSPAPGTDAKWLCDDNIIVPPFPPPFSSIYTPPSSQDPTQNSFALYKITHKSFLNLGNCRPGQLTIQGVEQMYNLGRFFRERYIKHYSFLKENLDLNEIHVRSTDTSRTISTAQNILLGLYPPSTRENQIITIQTYRRTEENMYPRSACERYNQLRSAIQHRPDYHNRIKDLENLFPPNTRHKPSWTGLYNIASSLHASGLPLPGKVTEKDFPYIIDKACHQTYDLYSNLELTRLGIGRFVQDLVTCITDRVELKDSSNTKLYLYSGHDNTLAPLLCAYGVFNGHPPMGSYIIFELWRDKTTKEHYVQMIYNHQRLRLEGCPESSTLCPYSKFIELSNRCIPVDFEAECRIQEES